MGLLNRDRARRVEPPASAYVGGGDAPDYATAFAARLLDRDDRSVEQWMRSILEDAPRILEWFVLLGWKLVLRLRLAPRGAPDAIAGWTIVETTPDSMVLEVRSSLVRARKVLDVEADRVRLTTYVWYESRAGRLVWSALAPVHHRIEPLLLTLAASRRRAG